MPMAVPSFGVSSTIESLANWNSWGKTGGEGAGLQLRELREFFSCLNKRKLKWNLHNLEAG